MKASDGTDSATLDVTIHLTDVLEKSDKPDKPTLAAVPGSSTSLTATWTKPGLNGGPDITQYYVQYREGTSGSWLIAPAAMQETTTITGLTASTSYQVRVRANNGEAWSDYSDPSDAVSTNASTNNAPVFSPTSTTREVAENSTAGTNVGAVIPAATDADTGDTLTYTLEGTDAASFDFDDSTRQIQTKTAVTYDYEAKSSYSVMVKASDGTDSATIDVTITLTDVLEKSDKPAKLTLAAVAGSSTTLTATWTQPGLNEGPDITGYNLQYKVNTASNWEDFTLTTGTAVTATVTGLTASTSYQVRVRAVNGETPSDWSDASDAVSTNAAGTAPTIDDVDVTSTPVLETDTYGAGETIEVSVTFNEAVNAASATDFVLSVAGAKRAPLVRGSGNRMRGEGPSYYRFGQRVLYRRDDLEEWAEARRVALGAGAVAGRANPDGAEDGRRAL